MKLWMLLGLLLAPALAAASDVAVIVDDSKPGTYLLTVGADGSVAVNPIRVVRPGQTPTNPPSDPSPPTQPTAFSGSVATMTKAAIANGGSATTAAGLSSVYSLVANGVRDGSIPEDSALQALKLATNSVLGGVPDGAKWTAWRTDLGNALETLRQQGALKIPSALDEVALGINTAIGHDIDPVKLASMTDAQLATAEPILEGIDIVKLIELIRKVMEIIELLKSLRPM